MEVTINGIRYRRREASEERRTPTGRLASFMAMASMLAGEDMYSSGISKKQKTQFSTSFMTNEYGLIQNKKSGLCKKDRDFIQHWFENNFDKIDSAVSSDCDTGLTALH